MHAYHALPEELTARIGRAYVVTTCTLRMCMFLLRSSKPHLEFRVSQSDFPTLTQPLYDKHPSA